MNNRTRRERGRATSGQWRLIAQTFLVMTDYPSKLYLYERIS